MIDVRIPGSGAVVPIPGTTNKVFIVAKLSDRDTLTSSIENDFCEVLNASDPFDPANPVIGYFIRTSEPNILDPGAWIQIKFQQEKFDAGYLTLIAADDIELDAAITILNSNASGGTILLKNNIALSKLYNWNLENIIINGRSHNFFINGFPFTITSRTCRFLDVWFTGTQTTDPLTFITQRMCYISNSVSPISSLDYLFEGCQFVRMIGTGLTPVIDITATGYLKITFLRCINTVQDITFIHEAFNINFVAGLATINIIIRQSGGTTSGSNNFRALGTLGSLLPAASYNNFITDGSAFLVTTNGLALTDKLQTSSLGTKRVDETGINNNTLLNFNSVSNKYEVLTIQNLAILLASIKTQKFVTIGVLGQFITIEAAIAAGFYNFILLENIILTQNINASKNNNYIIDLNYFTLNFGAFTFSESGTGTAFSNNFVSIFDGNIIYAHSVTGRITFDWEQTGGVGGMFLNNVKVTCNNTIAASYLFRNANNFVMRLTALNSRFILPNYAGTLMLSEGVFNNCEFTGGGASCRISAGTTYPIYYNCNFLGTFNNVNDSQHSLLLGNRGSATANVQAGGQTYPNISVLDMQNATLNIYQGTGYKIIKVSNCTFKTLLNNASSRNGNFSQFTNVEFVNMGGVLTLSNLDAIFTNCRFSHGLIVSNTARVHFIDCEGVSITLNGEKSKINGGVFSGALISNANDNSIINVMESSSISVNVANLRNIIIGNHCDTAIAPVAGNEFNNNVEY